MKKLGNRSLTFRGKEEKFGSDKNGNYMISLELIAEFDPFLATHIATCRNPGQVARLIFLPRYVTNLLLS